MSLRPIISAILLFIIPKYLLAAEIPLPIGIEVRNEKYYSVNDNMEMMLVRGGVFTLGSDTGHFDEKPAVKALVDSFLIDKHEVTNKQFLTFVEVSSYEPNGPWMRGYKEGQENFPVRFVTWHDAKAYADWAGKRLPTEAEWEYAAKGNNNFSYPWGNEWQTETARCDQVPEAGPAVVGSFPKGVSPFGCLDMGGNVWEWVHDWYDRWRFKDGVEGVVRNPTGPVDGALPPEDFFETFNAAGNEKSTLKVIKGGCWSSHGKAYLRTSKRMFGNPNYWFNDTGFRCVVSLKDYPQNKN